MKAYVFDVQLSKQEDGLWRAEVPSLQGCWVDAETIEKAIQGIQECAALSLDIVLEDGQPIPEGIRQNPKLPLKFSLPLVIEEHPMKRFPRPKLALVKRDLPRA